MVAVRLLYHSMHQHLIACKMLKDNLRNALNYSQKALLLKSVHLVSSLFKRSSRQLSRLNWELTI